ncbi:uncharacterized protein LOC130674434 isoform X1 [Microplitis mediator]|uniref:uncharacterized protein LOC130674434 isoform X1 n=1 Tax=Microplitis mediator TaxID=375433 RepID=UPI00255333FE|nr:uncharacterized protein LOC130674434 isoform X1 [Microplitis mediator]
MRMKPKAYIRNSDGIYHNIEDVSKEMTNMFPQQYCLRWKYHHSNLQTMFSQLLERQAYCDVTLACEGQTLRAHKVVLSACSTYFDTILSQYEEKDPIVIMRDVKFSDIKVLVEFMYKGEINIDHTRLSSLLKTAEDLHIKGLAEVSWRSDSAQNDSNNSGHSPGSGSGGSGIGGSGGGGGGGGGSSTGTPGVETVLREGDLDDTPPPHKQRRRGRPPLDDPPSQHDVFTPKVSCITGSGNVRTFSEEMMSEGDHESWDDETMMTDNEPGQTMPYLTKEENANEEKKSNQQATNSNATNPAVPEQFRDVIKMNDYLTTGRRQEFWEEPFTRRVMDAIKSKELEMKTAAEILGVSYGTLYGRYRDSYGCLKHPYRVRDFWSEPGPADVLAKLRRKEITLFRAAEFLNVTVHTLATYLSTLQGPDRISLAGELNASVLDSVNDTDDINDVIQKYNTSEKNSSTPASPTLPPTTLSLSSKRSSSSSTELVSNLVDVSIKASAAVLENNPDITIVKTENLQQISTSSSSSSRKRDHNKSSTATVTAITPTTTNSDNNNAKLMSGGGCISDSSSSHKLNDHQLSLNNDHKP